jgi:hypothetical protein
MKAGSNRETQVEFNDIGSLQPGVKGYGAAARNTTGELMEAQRVRKKRGFLLPLCFEQTKKRGLFPGLHHLHSVNPNH